MLTRDNLREKHREPILINVDGKQSDEHFGDEKR